jgi:hypothetical protein
MPRQHDHRLIGIETADSLPTTIGDDYHIACIENISDALLIVNQELPGLAAVPAPARVSSSVISIKPNDRVGAMDPFPRSAMKEFLHICLRLSPYLTDEECEELACLMYVVRQRTVLPYDELDDLAASLAFAKLSSSE